MRVFADPFALSPQTGIEGGELRWQTLGVVEGHLLLLVAHPTRDEIEEGDQPVDIIRILSARAADPKERQRYEQESR
jgi:uncharacterized DUF497 family protein